MFRSYSENQKKRIVDLHKEGNSAKQVADKLNIPYSTTASIIRKYKAQEVAPPPHPITDLLQSDVSEDNIDCFKGFLDNLDKAVMEAPSLQDVMSQLGKIKDTQDMILENQKSAYIRMEMMELECVRTFTRRLNILEEIIKSMLNSRRVEETPEENKKRSLFESLFPPRP
jgi:hypothetical protein